MSKIFSNKKRIVRYAFLIAAIIAAGTAVAVLTPVVIPPDAKSMISTYTRNKPGAEITVAYISPSGADIHAFRHNAREIDVPDREYEIGPLTQTFTGAMMAKAETEGLISLQTYAGDILPLPSGAYSPSVEDLVTHSSAYSSYVPSKAGEKRNPWGGITNFDVLYDMANFELTSNPPFVYSYSDFGAAAAGAVLGDLYGQDYFILLNNFVHINLGLKSTHVSVDSSPKNGWEWMQTDAYIASLGLTSTITDMVSYTRLYLNGGYDSLDTAVVPLKEINADTDTAHFWAVDKATGAISCGGSTGHYSAAIVMDKEKSCAAIVLSNYADDKYGTTLDIAKAVLNGNGQF